MTEQVVNPLSVITAPGSLKEKPKLVQEAFNTWISTKAPWVDAVAAGTFGAFQGAFLGTLMGSMTKMNVDASAGAPQAAMMMKMGGPLQQARNFAVMTGVNAGIATFMRRTRGVEDIQNSLVAAFGSGACFSLVSGMGNPAQINPMTGTAPNPLMGAFSAGVVFALFQGAFYKLGESFGGPKADDTEYARVTAMLSTLGLQKYEKNIKKGQLNDATIMLWDSAALQEVKVPPGPRLLILHHLDTYRHRDILRPAVPIPSSR